MTKIGRNDPCHCGSGKKYKKCCEEKDQQALLRESTTSHTGIFDNFTTTSTWNDEPNEPSDDNTLPISEEDSAIISRWWYIYEQINSIEDTRGHLEAFFKHHSSLVEYLGLEDDVIFDLATAYLREGRPAEFISFLMDFRQRFPAAYAEGATYYDFYIIAWLISEGRHDEIKNYLNYLAEDPGYGDEVEWPISLLFATNLPEHALYLCQQTTLRQEEALDFIFFHFLPSDIDDFTEEKIHHFVSELPAKSGIPNPKIALYWSKKFQALIQPLQTWPDKPLTKKSDPFEVLIVPISRFVRYLRDELNITWYTAQYYADAVSDYLETYHGTRKKPAPRLFHFPSQETIRENVEFVAEDAMGFTDATCQLATLNGLYYFADYLRKCGNFSDAEAKTLQEHCLGIYNEEYPSIRKHDYEGLCFGRFPLFELKS